MATIASVFCTPLIFFYRHLVNWHLAHCLFLITILHFGGNANVLAKENDGTIRKIRTVYPSEWDVANEAGLAYSVRFNQFYLVNRNQPHLKLSEGTTITTITPYENLVNIAKFNFPIANTANIVFDNQGNRLILLDSFRLEFVQIALNDEGLLGLATPFYIDTLPFGLEGPHGMDMDASGEFLFIFDRLASQILQVKLIPALESIDPGFSVIDLSKLDSQGLDCFAVNQQNHHLYVLNASRNEVHELSQSGELLITYRSAGLDLVQPHSMVFAPSTDLSDPPNIMHLFISDSKGMAFGAANTTRATGEIIEVALVRIDVQGDDSINEPMMPNKVPLGLVRTTDLSDFSTPSPDPSGIIFLPSNKNRFLIGDSEISEIPDLFTGNNLFELKNSGKLLRSGTTTYYSVEPTGLGYNPANKHIFISDDNNGEVFEIDPGADEKYGTIDDLVVGSFATRRFPSPKSKDPEGLTYDPDTSCLFIVDGANQEIYRVDPGTNGIFDGDDDRVTNFDTGVLGIYDPEGIHYSTRTGNLIVTGNIPTEFYEITISGSLVQTFDYSNANAIKPAGVTMAPGSRDSKDLNFYIVDRGIDNNIDPDENDGKMYELTLDTDRKLNTPPIVEALGDQTIVLAEGVTLTATVTDDGLPTPPGELTTIWSKMSGPGIVTFSDADTADTDATFSKKGTYVLSILADDGEFTHFDEVTIDVLGSDNAQVSISISRDADDAEQQKSAGVTVNSSDLELGQEDRLVGLRFNVLDIPQGAKITDAYIQFRTDERQSSPVSLTIQGEATDSAIDFEDSKDIINFRPRTSASVLWDPPPWITVGEAGVDQRTPNIRSVIREIVKRSGWEEGNSIVILISGSGDGKRTAESFNGSPSGAPLLHVEFE